MKVLLTRAARVRHEAGETVDVSPAEANFLLSTGSAVTVIEAAPTIETPEEKTEPKTTRRKK